MSLPKQCLYTNKIESSYAKNYNSNIASVNGTEFNLGETMIFNIPTGYNNVMSGRDSCLKFNFNCKNPAGGVPATACFNKCGAFGCIQRIRVFHGSVLLSDIDNYNVLMDMLISCQLSSDIVGGKYSILCGTGLLNGYNLITDNNAPNRIVLGGADAEFSMPFCLPLMTILSLTNNYVPLFAMTGSPLRIEIQLVSAINQVVISNANFVIPSVARKFVDNVELICNIMELSDSGMSIIKNAIGNAPVQWVVQDYRNYVSNCVLQTSVTQVSVPISAKFNSLNSLFFTFRTQANSAGANTFSSTESCNFILQEYFFRIGSKTMPYKPPNTYPEMFSELLRAFGSVSDVNMESNIYYSTYCQPVPVANDVNGLGSFYVGIDLESYSSAPLDTVYSGLNTTTDDIFANFKFAGQGGAINARIDTFALYDVLILIENGQCQVQY